MINAIKLFSATLNYNNNNNLVGENLGRRYSHKFDPTILLLSSFRPYERFYTAFNICTYFYSSLKYTEIMKNSI